MLDHERSLLHRAQTNDVAAFEELVRPYQPRLFRLLLAIARNRDDAEDSLQESLVAAYRALPTFRGDAAPLTWLTRIALNTARNWLRSEARASSTRLAERAQTFAYLPPANQDDNLLADERRALIRQALLALPDHYRDALIMRHYQDLPYTEIAAVLGVPIGTVRSRIAKGRALLLRALQATGYLSEQQEVPQHEMQHC